MNDNDDQKFADEIAERHDAEAQTVEVVALPCVVATVLPDGNIDVDMPSGPVTVNQLFVMAALLQRIANATMDNATASDRASRQAIIEIARSLPQKGGNA